MKQRYSHSQSSRKLRYLRFFPHSCGKTQALANTGLPCPTPLFRSALNHNCWFSLLSLIKEQLCWWLMASLSGPLPWPSTVQGSCLYPRPWCSISDMHDTVAEARTESWFWSTSALPLLTLPSPYSFHFRDTSATRELSPVSAGTVLLISWALNSPWRF